MKTLHELREETIDRILKCRPLCSSEITNAFKTLAKRLFERKLADRPLRGQHLFRFGLMPYLTGLGHEKVLEKSLAKEAKKAEDRRWANQIPIWSGVCGSGDRKTNIDIGYSPELGNFSLYELKIWDKHPLYAVVELITYALGYLIVRELAKEQKWSSEADAIRNRDCGLLDAKAIVFSVLAPVDFYKKPAREGRTLSTDELATLIACAKAVLTGVAKEPLGHAGIQIDVSLLAMQIEIPDRLRNEKDREDWIQTLKLKGPGTLRELVLQAKRII